MPEQFPEFPENAKNARTKNPYVGAGSAPGHPQKITIFCRGMFLVRTQHYIYVSYIWMCMYVHKDQYTHEYKHTCKYRYKKNIMNFLEMTFDSCGLRYIKSGVSAGLATRLQPHTNQKNHTRATCCFLLRVVLIS